MASELDVELEQYEEVVGREISTSVHRLEVDQLLRTRGHFTFQEPVQQVETISSCATTYPWPDPADSHALICSSAVDYGYPMVVTHPASCSNLCSPENRQLTKCELA